MNASMSAGRSTRARLASKTSLATRAAVLTSTSRMFDWGGNNMPSFSCSGVTWSATACAASMNIVGRALCVRGVDGHADRGEDVEVVGLRRQKRLAAEVDRGELHAAGIDRLALGPLISLLGQAFVVLDRVR